MRRKSNIFGLILSIVVVILIGFILMWAFSISNKKITKSVEVLNQNVFSNNLEKLKSAGKDYFTSEKLPSEVGDVESVSLDELIEEDYILSLTDKNGDTCKGKYSYVSVEKLDSGYEMKTYLECNEESDYVLASLDNCLTCSDSENNNSVKSESSQITEYQYKKTNGISYGEWSEWSEWSNVPVSKNEYRNVETKVVQEVEEDTFSQDDSAIIEINATCPEGYDLIDNKCLKNETEVINANPICETIEGYTLASRDEFTCNYVKNSTLVAEPTCLEIDNYRLSERNGFTCKYTNQKTLTAEPTCPSIGVYTLTGRVNFVCNYKLTTILKTAPTCESKEGYTLTGRDNFTCNYSKTTSDTLDPTCENKEGLSFVGRDGFTCNYSKQTTESTNPTCESLNGYTLTGRDNFTCNYSTQTPSYSNPTCPSVSGYTYSGRDGFTCNYYKTTTSSSYTTSYYSSGSGSYVPSDTYYYHYVRTSATYKYSCESSCKMDWYYTYDIYKKNYSTSTSYATRDAYCQTGQKSGNTCVTYSTSTTTKNAVCPSNYTKSGNTCIKTNNISQTDVAVCPSNYTKNGNTCIKTNTLTSTSKAVCPEGYNQNGNDCVKTSESNITRNASCPEGYTSNGTTCTKTVINEKEAEAICPEGYTKDGDICSKGVVSRKTQDAKCPEGYIKEGNECIQNKEITVDSEPVYTCPDTFEETENHICTKNCTTTITITNTKNVTYYRYQTREVKYDSVDYKWSNSKNDTELLNEGYVLTGKTR